jgi:hypothetical protein
MKLAAGQVFQGCHERSLPYSGAQVLHSCRLQPYPQTKHQTSLERLVRDKRFSLLRKGATYDRKKFYNIGPRSCFHNTFFGIIYAPSGATQVKTLGNTPLEVLIT